MTADWILTVAIAGGAIGLVAEVLLMAWVIYGDFQRRFVWKDDVGRVELLRSQIRVFPEFWRREVGISRRGLARGTALFVVGGATLAVVLAIFAVGLIEVIEP